MTTHTVFVYGTLMTDEYNHNHYLHDDWYIGKAIISGYDMYNIGAFPGIVPGEGIIPGELYEVDADTMERLDYLEGEGSLYIRESAQVTMSTGEKTFASIYVYNQSVKGLEKIPAWKQEDYVWYVSYGSNMLRERFMHYIEGGSYEGGGACHDPCEDTTQPLAVKTFDIPYDMYFGERAPSWERKGVSFLDITKPGYAKGVAYLITQQQFDHVALLENGGCQPGHGVGWYHMIVDLEVLDGIRAVTFTDDRLREYNDPSESYLDTLKRGLRENYPEMSEGEIDQYLNRCHR